MPRAVLLCARCRRPAVWLEDADGRCPGPRCPEHPRQETWIGASEDEAEARDVANTAESVAESVADREPRQMGLWEDA